MWTPPADCTRALRARPLSSSGCAASAGSTSPATRSSGTGRSPIVEALLGVDLGLLRASASHAPYERVLGSRAMPGAEWFPGARLNYAEHMLGRDEDVDAVAVVAHSQTREPFELTFGDLREQVARARARALKRLGVGPGDRVVAYLPNIPETLVAFLATASLGAIWATCPPEFGVRSVVRPARPARAEGAARRRAATATASKLDRPPRAGGRDPRAACRALETVVHVPYAGGATTRSRTRSSWDELLARAGAARVRPAAVRAPALRALLLRHDRPAEGDRARPRRHPARAPEEPRPRLGRAARATALQWFTTTAWMMWNALVSALLLRASIVMIDGNPGYPDLGSSGGSPRRRGRRFIGLEPGVRAWRAAREGSSRGGASTSRRSASVASAGSPLPLEGYEWLYEQFGAGRAAVNVGSGGTDVCTGHRPGLPAPARLRGRDRRRAASASTSAAFDPDGEPVVGELGELVIRQPMPSMPVGFWNDPDGARYRAAYFDVLPGRLAPRRLDHCSRERGSCGDHRPLRRDAQPRRRAARDERVLLRRRGDRRGARQPRRPPRGAGRAAAVRRPAPTASSSTTQLRKRIAGALRDSLSPRHAPDTIVAVPGDPADADRQEARGAGQAHPHRGRRRPRSRRATRSSSRARSSRSRTMRGRASSRPLRLS